ncbi:hypothetical protein FS837_005702 [Tulasnella sp. UAMH 9824]|nr:hypothetical protein FS837_005702 [Tulasnella sp. UAMH 9824]
MSSEAPKWDLLNEVAGTETAPSLDVPHSDESAALGVAPIKRVPFDIFQIIVTMCQENPSSTFQLTASHVCRRWREHVLVMPFMWNTMQINTRVPRWEMLETSLKRSGQAPLNIYIGQPPFVKSALPHLRKIMRMILPHLGRWRTLHLSRAPFKVRRVLLDQIRAMPAPLLEYIKISQMSSEYREPVYMYTPPRWRAHNVFVGFPNLKCVEWTSFTPNPKTLPSFKNLKSLILGEGTFHDMLLGSFTQLVHHILSNSPSLETFITYNPRPSEWDFAEPETPEPPNLTHHSLQTLTIESSPNCRTAVIRTLVLPKLRTYLKGHYLDEVDISCCGIIAQENSLPELRGITLSGDVAIRLGVIPVTDVQPYMPSLRPAIQNLAQLRVLGFKGVNFENERWLTDLGNCCPHLRWLRFIWCTGATIASIRLLVEMRMRQEGVTPLEYLFIAPYYSASPECRLNEEDRAWFSKLLKFGNFNDSWYYDTELETW